MEDEKKKQLIKYGIFGFVGLIILLIILMIIFSMGGKGSSNKKETSKEISLSTGGDYEISYKPSEYTWTSTDKDVAVIDDSGKISALKEGNTTITITTDDEIIVYKIRVTVDESQLEITSVKMEKNTIELELGGSYTMPVKYYPENARDNTLNWFSSNEKVVTVENGVIKVVGAGTCMVTVKSNNGNLDTCLVKVKGAVTSDVEEITFDSSVVELSVGVEYIINYSTIPTGVDEEIVWESTDPDVATVLNGVVKTVKEGNTTITAKGGDKEASLAVTVKKSVEETNPQTITLNQSEISLFVGDGYTLTAVVKPDDANDEKITWTSSDTKVAVVDEKGNVKTLALGTATITAKTSNDVYQTCTVNVVRKADGGNLNEATIVLNTSNLFMNVGDTSQLIETITPQGSGSVTWESSDPTVATVENGLVKALQNGKTTITVKLENGNEATCLVNVSSNNIVKVILLQMNARNVTLKVGGSSQLSVNVIPSNATNKTVTWSSDNTSVAEVDENGKVTAKKAGVANITAKSVDGISANSVIVVTK